MKKTIPMTSRKHGFKARSVQISRSLCLNSEADTHQAAPGRHLTTELICSATRQSYFWLTDRGRSRLIKH